MKNDKFKFIPSKGFAIVLPLTDKQEVQGVIVKRLNESQFTKGRVVKIGAAQNEWQGASFLISEPPAKEGDTIVYGTKYDFLFDGQLYHIVRHADVIGVIE